jgi:hypothetical protein
MGRGTDRIRVPGIATLVFIAVICLAFIGLVAGTAADFFRNPARWQVAGIPFFYLMILIYLFGLGTCVRFLFASVRNYTLLDDDGITIYKRSAAAEKYAWSQVPAAIRVSQFHHRVILLQIPGETPVLQVPFSPRAEALIGRHVQLRPRG